MNRGDHRGNRPFVARPPAENEGGADSRRRLDAMFPGAPPVRRGPPRGGENRGMPSPRRMRLERLRLAREPQEIQEAADSFLRHHHNQLPDDVDILLKILLHPDQKVLREALGQLSSLIFQGRLRNVILLCSRLDELAARDDLDEATRSLMDGLRAQADRVAPVDESRGF